MPTESTVIRCAGITRICYADGSIAYPPASRNKLHALRSKVIVCCLPQDVRERAMGLPMHTLGAHLWRRLPSSVRI